MDSIANIPYFKEIFVAEYKPEQLISYAEELLGGGLTVGYNNLEVLRYNPHQLERFDWEINVKQNANTFSLYLLGLRHIYLLSAAFLFNRNRHYLELAESFVNSFFKYYTKSESLHGMANNDHAIAERIENLIHLYHISKMEHIQLEFETQLIWIIRDSVEKLLGDTYYQRRHNHGIIVDKAALIGIYFLNEPQKEKYIEQIVDRLKGQVRHAYFNDGVHKENSIDYHFIVTALLWGCYYTLQHIGHDYYKDLEVCLIRANEFIIYAIKPDQFRPLFGDSKGIPTPPMATDGSIRKPIARTDVICGDPQLQYIYSQGKDGTQPTDLSKFFPTSGYLFFRQHFNQDSYQQATWLSLKAGYSTRIHKHKDDLSLCLYSKGMDIFVDSGMCGYMPRDSLRDYMESIPAHTALGIRNKTYSIASGNGDAFVIQRVTKGTQYDYALASSNVYDKTFIYRHIYYLRNRDIIVIRDEIHSEIEQSYAQYFNLSNYVVPVLTTDEERRTELYMSNTSYVTVIRQMLPVDEFNILEGGETDPPSYISTGFGNYEDSRTLEYITKGSTAQFITVIEIKPENAEDSPLYLHPDKLLIGPEELVIEIGKMSPVRYNGAKIICEENVLTIEPLYREDGWKYALYVFTEDEIKKFPYTRDKIIRYTHEGEQNFSALLFVANQSREKIKGILGNFRSTNKNIEVLKIYDNLHKPSITSVHMKQTNASHYYCSVNYKYDYTITFKWWLYFNGSCMHSEQNKSQVFEFNCDKPGEYVVMYSMHDKFFGEIVFDQFDKLIIES